jgi:glycerol kinase
VGEEAVISNHGLLGTVCYRLNGKTQYALEGAVEVAGAAIQWAKSIGLVTDTKNIMPEAQSVEDCGDVYFVPAFGGILSPYYRDDARGLLIGMSFNTTRGHLMRALLEAPCLRTAQVVEAMSQDSG